MKRRMKPATLRVGRPTNDLSAVRRFYVDGLGLEVLGGFEDHDGFDGLMVGPHGAPYHLEFTTRHGHDAGRAPTEDNLLVFYLPDANRPCQPPTRGAGRGRHEVRARRAKRAEATNAHAAAVARMRARGFHPVRSFNPYWDRGGVTFEDVDGYRVVLFHGDWPR